MLGPVMGTLHTVWHLILISWQDRDDPLYVPLNQSFLNNCYVLGAMLGKGL